MADCHDRRTTPPHMDFSVTSGIGDGLWPVREAIESSLAGQVQSLRRQLHGVPAG